MNQIRALILLAAALLPACDNGKNAPPTTGAATEQTRTLTRLMVQDHETRRLRWVDVTLGDRGTIALGPIGEVAGFKQLEIAQQKLVQMAEHGGFLLVGVRDEKEGAFESGWILARTGVEYEDHGNHGHWHYEGRPEVVDSRLDTNQGNPAHLYVYDGRFYLANDRLGGYTRVTPAAYQNGKKGEPLFIRGGGNHITLAVVDNSVGYSTWIDGGGPNKGRVDVTPIRDGVPCEPAYSLTLPSGGIHGAIANSGKVFFAPADGICWVNADRKATQNPDSITIEHISLGKDGDKPRRTGAFVAQGRYVMCTTGRDSSSSLVILDAAAAQPQPRFVPLNVKKGTRAITPILATNSAGKNYALVFHDRVADAEVEDALEIIDLDPDGDGDFTAARVVKTLSVGPSAVQGHYGHHDAAVDADGRYAFFTNPGAGTISALSLKSLEIVAHFKVGGQPTALIAHGGIETDD